MKILLFSPFQGDGEESADPWPVFDVEGAFSEFSDGNQTLCGHVVPSPQEGFPQEDGDLTVVSQQYLKYAQLRRKRPTGAEAVSYESLTFKQFYGFKDPDR